MKKNAKKTALLDVLPTESETNMENDLVKQDVPMEIKNKKNPRRTTGTKKKTTSHKKVDGSKATSFNEIMSKLKSIQEDSEELKRIVTSDPMEAEKLDAEDEDKEKAEGSKDTPNTPKEFQENYAVATSFDYASLMEDDPEVPSRGYFRSGFDILGLIVDIAKSISYTQMNTAINNLLHPAEYNYSKEILGKISEIEENIGKLVNLVQLSSYKDAVEKRRDLLIGLTSVTTSYYKRYVETVKELGMTDDPAKVANLSKEAKDYVMAWSKKICNGTNVYYCCLNLIRMCLSRSASLQGLSYPEIYDKIGDASYLWRSQSYPFRESLRDEDKYAIFSSLVLTEAYFQLKVEEGDKVAKEDLENLRLAANQYAKFMRAHATDVGTGEEFILGGRLFRMEQCWSKLPWTNRTAAAMEGKWRINRNSSKGVHKRFYYGGETAFHIGRYPELNILQKMCEYFGNTKSLYEILSMNYLKLGDTIIHKFDNLDPGAYFIVQGDFTWTRKLSKGHDKIFTQMVPMSYKGGSINTSTESVTDTNLKGVGMCPQDSDPDMIINMVGKNTHYNCGIYAMVR